MIDKELDDIIRKDIISPKGRLNSTKTNIFYIESKGWKNYLFNRYPLYTKNESEELQLKEIFYRIKHKIEDVVVCKTCGNIIPFKNRHFNNYCNKHCANINPEVLAKNSAGVTRGLKKVYAERKEEIQAKRAKTMNERYGENTKSGSPFELKRVQEKNKQIFIEKYGVDNVFRLSQFRGNTREQQQKKWKQIWKERGFDIDYGEGDMIIVHNACPIHGDVELLSSHFHNRIKSDHGNALEHPEMFCLQCHPLDLFSTLEGKVAEFLNKAKQKYSANNRSIISPYELDFYLPDKDIAIECNGMWFHSLQADTPDDYHFMKYQLCKEKGIKLFNVWEDWIKMKWDQTQWMLIKTLDLVTEKPDYYTNAEVKLISNYIGEQFCKTHGLYQYKYFNKAKCTCVGAYLNGELIKVWVGHVLGDDFIITDIVSAIGHFAYTLNQKAINVFKENINFDKFYCICSNDLYDDNEFDALNCKFKYISENTITYIYHNMLNEGFERIDDFPHMNSKLPKKELLDKYYRCQNSGFRVYESIQNENRQ